MSAAAKDSTKTSTFLNTIDSMLETFDDEILSVSTDAPQAAYYNLVTTYNQALGMIWDKAGLANIDAILDSVTDKEFKEYRRMVRLLQPEKEQSQVEIESRAVPQLESVLGTLVNQFPQQKLPDKEVYKVISNIFKSIALAHKYNAQAAKCISDLAGLVTPEQFTVILAAAVPPTVHLVLPEGCASPLAVPPPRPTNPSTDAGKKEMMIFCKSTVLPDPNSTVLAKYDRKAPTRVLAAALYCQLEKRFFRERTMQSEIANIFRITGAQLSKSITGIDYVSGPHHYKKRKAADADSTTKPPHTVTDPMQSQAQTTSEGARPSTSTAKCLSSMSGRTKKPPTK